MGALTYLFFTKQKNRLREYLRSPSKLILLLFMVAFFGLSFYTRSAGLYSDSSFRSIDEFYAIVSLVYTMVFINVSKSGFSNGASFFSLADINLIFVSPSKSTSALFYGIIQQFGSSLYLGAFILLQYSLSFQLYGIKFMTIVLVAFGYGITVLLSQMCSMLIYVFTSSSDKKAAVAKTVYCSVIGFFVVALLFKADVFGDFSFSSLVSAVRSSFFAFVPVSGVVSLFVEGLATLNPVKIIIGILFVAVLSLLFYFVLSKAKGEYYEDVLKSAEASYSAITAAKEGKNTELTARNVKVGKAGFSKGYGAAAIKEKHKIENRRGKVLFLSRTSLVTLGTTVLYSFFVADSPLTVFVLSVYSLAVTVSTGRWMKEITMPYVYLIPEKPFKKLLNVISEQIPSVIFESIICFIPLHFILGSTVEETASMIIARCGFGLVFTGSNLVYLKLIKRSEKTFFTMTVYTLIAMLFCIPGALAGAAVHMMFWYYGDVGYLATLPVNILVFLILLFFCRNILEYSEFNNK